MTELPTLTESSVRQRASSQSWQRGRSYFHHHQVTEVIWREGLLTAEVQGSAYEPYLVQVSFRGDEIQVAHCTCPYEWGGDCKHIVAALLYLVHNREQIDQRPPLSELLSALSREQLVALLLALAEDPRTAEDIEQRVPLIRLTQLPEASPGSKPEINASLIRRQIKAELRGAFQTGYDGWGEERWYESDLGVALKPAISQARAYLDAGYPQEALQVLEVATEAWEEAIDSQHEYVRESFEDVAEEFTRELGETWAEALLTADLDPDERT